MIATHSTQTSVQVDTLDGPDLDRAAALALGYVPSDGSRWPHRDDPTSQIDIETFSPTTDGALASAIIDEKWIGIERPSRGQKTPVWRAIKDSEMKVRVGDFAHRVVSATGPNHVIAALRALVKGVYGDTMPAL